MRTAGAERRLVKGEGGRDGFEWRSDAQMEAVVGEVLYALVFAAAFAFGSTQGTGATPADVVRAGLPVFVIVLGLSLLPGWTHWAGMALVFVVGVAFALRHRRRQRPLGR